MIVLCPQYKLPFDSRSQVMAQALVADEASHWHPWLYSESVHFQPFHNGLHQMAYWNQQAIDSSVGHVLTHGPSVTGT